MNTVFNQVEKIDTGYRIKLDIFEGPLDLLLHLIEKAEVDIYNIPIALITDQFLEYLKTMELLNLQVAGDFLVMAATLMQIKVRMLLPHPVCEEEEEEEVEEDPRMELVERLIEYKKIKEAARILRQREEERMKVYCRSGGLFADRETAAAADPDAEITLWDLVQAFRSLLESLTPRLELEGMPQEEYSVQDKMNEILSKLKSRRCLFFTTVFSGCATRKAIVTYFLALLELIRLRKAKVRQEGIFGEIEIIRWEEGI